MGWRSNKRIRFLNSALWGAAGLLALRQPVCAQGHRDPGKSIGAISVRGNLIVMTLDEGSLGKASLFDLAHRTLRFTPETSGYRAENVPWRWDADFGQEMTGNQATLTKFGFPFSGKTWNSFFVGMSGSIAFGEPVSGGRDGGGSRDGGISVARFAELARRPALSSTPDRQSASSSNRACQANATLRNSMTGRLSPGPHRAVRWNSGHDMVPDREPLSGGAGERWDDRDVI